jgi:TolC family type I secretion outer membrane protein
MLMASTAWPVAAETLGDALSTAYTTNPNLDAQRASLRATDELVPQALSGWRPTVQVTGQAGYERSDSNRLSGLGVQELNPRSVALQASQPLFRGFRTLNGTSQAENTVLAARAQLASTEQSVLLSAVQAYMDVIRDQAVLELNQNNVEVLRRQLEASNDRFRVGEITRTDVAQSEAAVSGAISGRTQSEATLTSSRAAYQRVVGRMPEKLEPPPPLPPLPATEEEARAIALAENPDLAATRLAELAAADSVKVAKGALLPNASLVGSLTQAYDTTLEGDNLNSASVVAQVQVPLYQSGAEYSQIRQAQESHSQRRIEIASAERAVIEGVTNAWEQLRSARAVITSSREQVRANEIALDGVRQEAAVGSRTTLDVLDAEQTLLNSRVTLVRAQREEYVAGFQLLSAIGRLDARNLKLNVPVYDPTENYKDVREEWIGYKKDEAGNESILP